MHHLNTELAISQGHPPPTQGYQLSFTTLLRHSIWTHWQSPEIRYLLTKCSNRPNDKYEHFEYDETGYNFSHSYVAIKIAREMWFMAQLCFTIAATCQYTVLWYRIGLPWHVRCLLWPPQAADWPTRNRNYDWPDTATLDRVVSNGCDVVGVAHRQCKKHEWMNKYQWRLPFSRAEIVLLNNWMPVQQITYHLLRDYVKIRRLTEIADNSKPVSYTHLTLPTNREV